MEGPIPVIKRLVRSFRRLRLFKCGFLKRPTAPLHAPKASRILSNPKSAPNVFVLQTAHTARITHYADNYHALCFIMRSLSRAQSRSLTASRLSLSCLPLPK